MSVDQATLDSLLAGAFGATVVIDLSNDRILGASAEAQALLRQAPLAGHRFSTFVHGHLGQLIVFVDEVLHRGMAWTRRIQVTPRDGEALDCEINGKVAALDRGAALVLQITDLAELDSRAEAARVARLYGGGLHEWQRAQSFFSELEQQNQLILNAAGEGIYGVNADGKTTFVNRAAQEMLGWTADDLLGQDIHSKIHHHHLDGELYPSQECPIYQSFRFEEVNRIEDEVFWRKDGKPIRVEYVSTPIYEGKVLAGAVVIFRDITERWENEQKLREALEEVAALRDKLEQENAYLQEAINIERAHHDIIGQSPSIREILARIEMVSRTNANVLITGESGTGKAMVATAIHADSDRRRRPLIHFKCASVNPDMIESELFGHVRGAFTAALRDKPGKLELAHGGTLFLDEFADIPLEQQGMLLEALQSRRVTRMGDTRPRELDLRVVASTSRNLEREVQAGRVRQDLMFFLNVFPIQCTPLRERIDDIPPLTVHLLKLACKRLGIPVPVITEGIIRTLQRYDWPGNVRELANVIERAAIVSRGDKLRVDIRSVGAPAVRGAATLLTEAEVDQIRTANTIACLRETGGKVSGPGGAAELLGIRPTTLYSRIRKLGLQAEG
ncbi:sigma 54-interacting transcriptional regulator [Jannaschia ovalis]|uniref:Sigma 54-interacting transcriptional regulator n=1 Tax=Jannaschia ovalis TaxID=3038773 RepID=A0ABY8LBS4_9RHOB|nr:sigma 54-interacting transcriptional regulator [Jannaschia sp. GRR-S6-38]WGH78586.1 sigma 54-interacting transcriptional regulator [Jannaschia sp. GRR-S6-38]